MIPYKEEVTGSNPIVPSFLNYRVRFQYEIQKDIGAYLVILSLTWQIFSAFRSSYTPAQVILVVTFAYLGTRLSYFVYFKNKL